jgi:hypothetical protein
MPLEPQGQRRPAAAIVCVAVVGHTATGDDVGTTENGKVRLGRAGAAVRTAALSLERRAEIARKAAQGRWR